MIDAVLMQGVQFYGVGLNEPFITCCLNLPSIIFLTKNLDLMVY